MLPQGGLKTVWNLQTSEGKPIGTIQIGGFHKGPKRGANPIEIGGQEFWIRKNIEGLLQNGFLIQSHSLNLKLVRDDDFGLMNMIKTRFINLKLISSNETITVQADKNDRIILAKNGIKIGIATYRRGMFPGFAAMPETNSDLEKIVLFYSMLLV